MPDHFDPYYTWLGIPREEQPPDHYRLLGVRKFENNFDVISNAVDQRMAHLRSLQSGARAAQSQEILNELSRASVCLLNAEKKAAYDRELRQKDAPKLAKSGSGILQAKPLAPAPKPAPAAASSGSSASLNLNVPRQMPAQARPPVQAAAQPVAVATATAPA